VLDHVAGGDRVERAFRIGDAGEIADIDRDAVRLSRRFGRQRIELGATDAPAPGLHGRGVGAAAAADVEQGARRQVVEIAGGVAAALGLEPKQRRGPAVEPVEGCAEPPAGTGFVRLRRGVVAVVGSTDVLGDHHRVLPDEATARIAAAPERPASRDMEVVVHDRRVQQVSGRAAEQAARLWRSAQRTGRRGGRGHSRGDHRRTIHSRPQPAP
jgi:hypothetical protein